MPEPITFADDLVVLEPLTRDHAEALGRAVADGDLGDLWYTSTPQPDAVESYIAAALAGQAAGTMTPFAVRDRRRGLIVGSTRFYDWQLDVPRVAIGYTWYAASAQRTHVNTACKRLLLGHAFDQVGCATVQFHTDYFNQRSRAAIERLGAHPEGILRSHQRRPDGTLRDTVCFGILAAEWPDVRRTLDHRIARSLR